MSNNALIVIGVIIGILFGMNGIATLFNFLNIAIEETYQQFSQVSAVSTLILLIIAIILIIQVRVISALIVGAIIGAVLNTILEINGIHVMNNVYKIILNIIHF